MDADPEFPLEVTGLVKRYGRVTAVQDVSFRVPRGTVFCLLGPNGAGKTTTLEVAQGIRKPTEGSVRVFGHDPRGAPVSLRRRLGVLPQKFMSFESLTVRENVEYFAGVYDVSPDVPAILESLGLGEYAKTRYRTLSIGTKQRVGIATALVNDPELIFLDEPTAGVDPASRRQLWDIIRRFKKEGRSVVLTTHYMDEAERLADEVAIIHKGRMVANGSPEEVRHAYGGGTIVRIVGLSGRLPASILARPGVLEEETGVVSIPLADASEGPLVIAELVKSGVAYEEIAIREPTLDEAFVRIVANQGA